MKHLVSTSVLLAALAIPSSASAASDPCGGVELRDGIVSLGMVLPASGPLDEPTRECLSHLGRELAVHPGLRAITVAARVPDRAREGGKGLAVANDVVGVLAGAGVKRYLLSAVAPATAAGEAPSVRITYRESRQRRVVARILAWSGAVEISSAGKRATPVRGAGLGTYDHVTTMQGNALVQIADGSMIRVGPDTDLQLGAMDVDSQGRRRVRLYVHEGQIQTIARPGEAGSFFDIVTRVAVAGVRGTSFRVVIDDSGRTRVETLEGEVEVGAAGGSVAVPAGMGSRVDTSGVPMPPRSLLPAVLPIGPLRGGLARGGRLEWSGVTGAVSYRVELARDAELSRELESLDTATASLALAPARATGRWYWRVAGVDADGFTGSWSKTYGFTIE